MGRTTSGVTGMRFRKGDELLSMAIIPAETDEDSQYVFTMTDEGYAKRTAVSDFRLQNRGGLGVRAMRMKDDRGGLVAALVVSEDDEIISFKASGQVIRSSVADVTPTGRDTMGVKFVGLRADDQVVAVTVNSDRADSAEETTDAEAGGNGDDQVPAETVDAAAGDEFEDGSQESHDAGAPDDVSLGRDIDADQEAADE